MLIETPSETAARDLAKALWPASTVRVTCDARWLVEIVSELGVVRASCSARRAAHAWTGLRCKLARLAADAAVRLRDDERRARAVAATASDRAEVIESVLREVQAA